MSEAGKVLIAVGLTLTLFGAVLWLAGRTGFRGLPGDIVIETDHVRFYFPIVSGLLLSLLLSGLLWVWQWLSSR